MMSTPRSLADRVKDRIRETCEAGLILQSHMNALIAAIDERELEIRVPERVTARLVSRQDPSYGFDIFRCPRCGRLYHASSAFERRLRCPNCEGASRMTQAPIFGAVYKDRPPTPVPYSEVIRSVTIDRNSRYCIYQDRPLPSGGRLPRDFLKGLVETNTKRPIESMCWSCPIPEVRCEYRDDGGFCLYSHYEGNWRPELQRGTGRIRLVPPPLTRRTPFGTFLNRYRPLTISEGATKPIRIAVHNFRNSDAKSLEFHQDELPGISEILYVKKLQILQFTIALALGLPYTPIRKRPVRLLTERSVDGTDTPYFLSRLLVTEGIVVRLRGDARDAVVTSWAQQRRDQTEESLATTLYHTVSHAFLKPLPMIAGLDANEFGESFSAPENEVALYDNSPGGIGGIKTVVEEWDEGARLVGDYAAQLLNSTACQLDCSWSCKACLHLGSCGWINRQLRRDMLQGIINERLRNRYFGS